jgi:5'-deoxynucleotidase YfbR-like HD superfamily hydrolase
MKDIETLKDIEERVRESLVRIDCVVEETANKVLAIFDEAEKRLHDPNVRIVKQLDKAKSYAQALRTELADAKSQLEKCRSKGTSLNEMISSLKVELVVAKRENARLAQKTDWVAEVGPVKPIRRR